MNEIRVSKKNETFLYLNCHESICHEIADHFSVQIPNYRHLPAFTKSKGKWDGKIKLFSAYKRNLYYGLIGHLANYAREHKIKLHIDDDVLTPKNWGVEDVKSLLDANNCPLTLRDYQEKAVLHALNFGRTTIESPTASGKSFIIYASLLALMNHIKGKIVIIVPTTSLVEQIYSDFAEYGMDVEQHCARIYEKYPEKYPEQKIIISTWQSIFTMKEEYFHQFDVVFGDEAHGFDAKSLKHIMENCINAEWRVGLTGTVPKERSKRLLIEGLFGPVFVTEKSKTLIEQGYLNETNPFQIIQLIYTDEERKRAQKFKYQEELSFLIEHEKRNNYIKDLVIETKGNTLVLFDRVQKHGKPLYNLIKENTDKKVFYISGETKVKAREKIRKIVNDEKDATIVASSGTFSTGVNIPTLDNLIFAASSKDSKKVLQSIGRVLRKSNLKTTVYDLIDDLSWNDNNNYIMNHGLERLKIYAREEFEYEVRQVVL